MNLDSIGWSTGESSPETLAVQGDGMAYFNFFKACLECQNMKYLNLIKYQIISCSCKGHQI